jgi:isoleucyl-tRNA synthetase
MLVTQMDENLKQMGFAREVVNKIQKLRKAVKLNIDDPIEVFYLKKKDAAEEGSAFSIMLSTHLEAIKNALKVPFINAEYKQDHFLKIAETEYINPENENEIVQLFICVPNIAFDDNKLNARYG